MPPENASPWTTRAEAALSELRGLRLAARGKRAEEAAPLFPSRSALAAAVEHLSAALFPRRLGRFGGSAVAEDAFVREQLGEGLRLLHDEIAAELAYWQPEARVPFDPDHAATIVTHFTATIPSIRALIDSDVEAAFLGDPAARCADEILVCYPGALASLHHRIAHALHGLGAPISARIISELANERTGIDIHPGATIGPSFFIDHGTGVVIGETAIIGARVRLYQHVTLGARTPLGTTRPSVRDRYARHPIVEDDVVIYAGATILGRVTIGRGATIGGNVWLLADVPAGSVVLQPAAGIVERASAAAVRETLAGPAT
ncbi:serine O-acetyltransferase EpsC [Allosphingosinicella deserti]|uniref:serine O-acetyltransferase n=1 Tax=Allosphingosinicella deserti TaxID=2116704 RepID=A0A2P7R079_9SPHN|nr:serine O-acetyltransferase EpsC [Sphingomonas deserti]PSJ43622.1 serine acetyltransferase [Sphingomonas deserti]